MPRILASGDTALVVEFGDKADRRLSSMVLSLDARIRQRHPVGVVETVPTLRSLMIHYDPNLTSHAALAGIVAPLAETVDETVGDGRTFELPVCYDDEFAPDLGEVAVSVGLRAQEVVELHASVPYRVYTIGFLPGLPYMGDLPEQLQLPRRTTPRTNVPAGTVAIATTMSVVYPLESPGGWHLIGRTPVRMFDLTRPEPALLTPADEVIFKPVSRAEYDRLLAAGGRA